MACYQRAMPSATPHSQSSQNMESKLVREMNLDQSRCFGPCCHFPAAVGAARDRRGGRTLIEDTLRAGNHLVTRCEVYRRRSLVDSGLTHW